MTGTGQESTQQQVLRVIMWAQVFSGLGVAAGVTVGALLVESVTGSKALLGAPIGCLTLGSAIAAYAGGQVAQHQGRRVALVVGYAGGAVGAIIVIVGAWAHSLAIILTGMVIYGTGTAANLQARYAATDLAAPEERGRALSYALIATTVGALIAPNSTRFVGSLAASVGLPHLVGPFLLSVAGFGASSLIVQVFLRPDPLLLAQRQKTRSSRRGSDASKPGATLLGAAVMVTAQLVMVGIMAMTPVHMGAHHSLPTIGMVISVHIAAMYLPSLLTGTLVDTVGTRVMAIASGTTLIIAGVLAAVVPVQSAAGMVVALAVLGLGWNMGLIAGSTMIVKSTRPDTRASTQGTVDIAMAAAGASGGMMSGMVLAHSSYHMLSLVGAGIAVIPIVLVLLRAASGVGQQQPTGRR